LLIKPSQSVNSSSADYINKKIVPSSAQIHLIKMKLERIQSLKKDIKNAAEEIVKTENSSALEIYKLKKSVKRISKN
jgi:hypothetical protein